MLRTSLQQPITPVDDIDSIHHGIGARSIIMCLGARSPPLYIRMFPRDGHQQRAPILHACLVDRRLPSAYQQCLLEVIQQRARLHLIAVDEEIAVQPACDRQPRSVGLHGHGNEFPAGRLDRSTPHTHDTP